MSTTGGAGEVTIAELARRFDYFLEEYRSDRREEERRHQQYVLQAVYEADQRRRDEQLAAHTKHLQALSGELATERDERKKAQDQLRANVRWWWTAVVVPGGALLAQIAMMRGR